MTGKWADKKNNGHTVVLKYVFTVITPIRPYSMTSIILIELAREPIYCKRDIPLDLRSHLIASSQHVPLWHSLNTLLTLIEKSWKMFFININTLNPQENPLGYSRGDDRDSFRRHSKCCLCIRMFFGKNQKKRVWRVQSLPWPGSFGNLVYCFENCMLDRRFRSVTYILNYSINIFSNISL